MADNYATDALAAMTPLLNASCEVERALQICVVAHAGQVDRQGAPYALHPIRVALRLACDEDATEAGVAAALLHDVVEDTDVTIADLATDPVLSSKTVWLVDVLTRRENEPYGDYIDRIEQAGADAIHVKLADLADNLHPDRPLDDAPGLRRRYEAARRDLGAKLWEVAWKDAFEWEEDDDE